MGDDADSVTPLELKLQRLRAVQAENVELEEQVARLEAQVTELAEVVRKGAEDVRVRHSC